MLELNKIHQGDCLERLKKVEDKVKDVVEGVEEALHLKKKENLTEAEKQDLQAQLEQEKEKQENVSGVVKDIKEEIEEAEKHPETAGSVKMSRHPVPFSPLYFDPSLKPFTSFSIEPLALLDI